MAQPPAGTPHLGGGEGLWSVTNQEGAGAGFPGLPLRTQGHGFLSLTQQLARQTADCGLHFTAKRSREISWWAEITELGAGWMRPSFSKSQVLSFQPQSVSESKV